MTKYLLIMAWTTLWSSSAYAATNCEDGATTMAEVRACLSGENEARVNTAYVALLSKVSAKSPELAPALQASQRSWHAFASDSCDFYAGLKATVSGPQDLQVNCRAQFSQARIRVLGSWEAQLDALP